MAQIGELQLPADVTVPAQARGVVIFAHGSGSSRLSPRNRQVARYLNQGSFATVLFDLLTEAEAADRRNVFDIPLLAERMSQAIAFAQNHRSLHTLPIGLFGASTGAAAALVAAARHGHEIAAVVSRGGRPDMAGATLGQVKAPTLLIVSGEDGDVLELNRRAARQLHCVKRLEIVAGATHLFEEPGMLDRVMALAADWFTIYFGARP